ncbi:hypothetical protein D3C81_2147980 [compost metagenome]
MRMAMQNRDDHALRQAGVFGFSDRLHHGIVERVYCCHDIRRKWQCGVQPGDIRHGKLRATKRRLLEMWRD